MFATIVQGSWNALQNIQDTIGKGASTFVSGFFPTQQREKVTGGSPAQAEGAGLTYRPVLPEFQSLADMWLLEKSAATGGIGPYELQSASAKVQESQQLAAKISTETQRGPVETIVDVFGKFTTGATKIRTAADEFMMAWGLKPREPISEGSGGVIQNLDDLKTAGAQVFTLMKGAGNAILDQVKGLFNLGYEPTGSQPVFSIQHELDPKTKTTAMVAVAAIVIALLLFGRKK